jgi:heme o synthase
MPYREDYEEGGIQMLPVVEADGRSTARQILLYSLALIPISLLHKNL